MPVESISRQLANLGHDMRTPLSVILNTVQFLEKQEEITCLPELKQIERSARQLTRLVGNVIDLSGLESGRIHLIMQPVETVSWMHRVYETCVPYAQHKGVDLTFASQDEVLWVQCDAVKLERCVLNLISNAVRFTDAGGLVCLAVEADGADVCISVSDNGCGIDARRMAMLFEGTKDEEPQVVSGGLGLPLVKSFMECMQGTLEIESEVGEGTCARLRLSRMDPPSMGRVNVRCEASSTAVELSTLPLDPKGNA